MGLIYFVAGFVIGSVIVIVASLMNIADRMDDDENGGIL